MSEKFDFDKLDEEIKTAFSGNFTDEEIEAAQDNRMYEFANLPQSDTGLSVNIWIDDSGFERSNKHSPYRIKFQNNTNPNIRQSDLIPMSISDNPEILVKGSHLSKVNMKIAKEVFEFVKKYHNELRDVVDKKISLIGFGKIMDKDKEQLNG